MSETKILINYRKYMRSQITVAYNKRDTFEHLPASQKLVERNKLLSIENDLKQHNFQIQLAKADEYTETTLEDEFKKCTEYSDRLTECLVLLEVQSRSESNQSAPRSILKTPIAPLPSFEGKDGENWTRFIFSFEATISKFSFPDFDKYLLLKQQLKGSALTLINALECDKQTYKDAVDLLKSAFASPEIERLNTFNEMKSMKLLSTSDPMEYMGAMKRIEESFNKLNIVTNQVLEHFFFEGMNETFKSILIQITNKSQPNLEEIKSNYFEAVKRYKVKEKSDQSVKSKSKTNNFAIKVDSNSQNKFSYGCILCKADKKDPDHPVFRCIVYKDSFAKLNKLKELNGCVRCGSDSHNIKSCQYRFKRRCDNCNSWHFNYLCSSSSKTDSGRKEFSNKGKSNKPETKTEKVKPETKKEKSKSETKDDKVSSDGKVEAKITTMVTDGYTNIDISSSILQTFTAVINDTNIRSMKDGGCQSNFITNSVADHLKLNVIQTNFNLTVNGFNGSRSYETRIVEVPLRVGVKTHNLQAICVPKINTNLN